MQRARVSLVLLFLVVGGMAGFGCVDLGPGDGPACEAPPCEPDDDVDDPPPPGGGPGNVVLEVRDCTVHLSHRLDATFGTVAAAGEFNGWNPEPMTGPDGDGGYSLDIEGLAPGEYAYKLVFDGTFEGAPPPDVYSHWLDGLENRNLRVGDCMTPLLQTTSASIDAAGELRVVAKLARAADEVALDAASVSVTVGGVAVTPSIDEDTGEVVVAASGLPPGKHTVKVWAADHSGRRAENEPLFVPLWVEQERFTWDDALLYFVFTDRFRNGDWDNPLYEPTHDVATCANFQGGDFLGAIHALEEDYFARLGVNTLWLSPVLENPEGGYIGMDGVNNFSGYHGYWPVRAGAVEERLGDAGADSAARLHELIALAHSKGIRVMFDLVLNHVHEDHEYVSTNPEWFGSGCVCGTEGCSWDDRAVDCWFMPYLPDLDYKNHDILQRVADDTIALLAEYDVDAVRIDAAKHMDHVIMRTLSMRIRDELERGGEVPFYIVGETFTTDRDLLMDYVGETELDGQFDFPLFYGIRNTFISSGSFQDLEATVAAGEAAYGNARMSPFLGNHDVDRFTTELTGAAGNCWDGYYEEPMLDGGSAVTQWDIINRLSMAFAFTLTQPGVPLIYYGDEVGLHGRGDPDNRRLMNFDPYLSGNQAELLERMRVIGGARASSAALRRGDRVQLWVDDDLLVYARDLGGGDVAIVAMNKGWGERTAVIDVSALGIEGVTLRDAVVPTRTAVAAGGFLSLTLGSWDYAILLPE